MFSITNVAVFCWTVFSMELTLSLHYQKNVMWPVEVNCWIADLHALQHVEEVVHARQVMDVLEDGDQQRGCDGQGTGQQHPSETRPAQVQEALRAVKHIYQCRTFCALLNEDSTLEPPNPKPRFLFVPPLTSMTNWPEYVPVMVELWPAARIPKAQM